MFGQQLLKLRKERNLSQYQLASLLNFTRGQIANYEQGKREPDFQTVIKIADFFDVTVDYLMGREPKPESLTREEQQFMQHVHLPLEKIRQRFSFDIDGKPVTDEELAAVISYIRALRKQS